MAYRFEYADGLRAPMLLMGWCTISWLLPDLRTSVILYRFSSIWARAMLYNPTPSTRFAAT